MNVHYWPLGSRASQPLPFTDAQISAHLIEDWVPALPPAATTAFFGWPAHVLGTTRIGNSDYLTIDARMGQTERQWKGVLSWMLGVAGTRQVLSMEGYRWIAPLSAFYPGPHPVALGQWPSVFPASSVTAGSNPQLSVRLRPDYLAIRSRRVTGKREWAAAESKGTNSSLKKLHSCPAAWRDQAHNVQVCAHGVPVRIARHMVVATRTNPNAKRSRTRSLQVRLWNAEMTELPEPPADAAADVAAAHLFGLCRNLGLTESARLLGLGVEARLSTRRSSGRRDQIRSAVRDLAPRADEELRRRTDASLGSTWGTSSGGFMQVATAAGPAEVDLEAATLSLIRALGVAEAPDQAAEAWTAMDEELDVRGASRAGLPEDETSGLLPSGVRVRVPRFSGGI